MTVTDQWKAYFAVLEVLQSGDQDQQPWAFYEHDHGGFKGYQWTKQQAMAERINFVHAVIKKIQETER